VQDFKTVLNFAWQYMRPYWTRLVAGIVLGCLCGATAALFIWATGMLTSRLEKNPEPTLQTCPYCSSNFVGTVIKEEKKNKPSLLIAPEVNGRIKQWGRSIEKSLDPWLPRIGMKLTWRQAVGGMLFLASIALLRGTTDYASNYCMGWVSERVVNDLRCDVLGKLTSLSLDYFNRSTTGDMLTRVNADTVNLHRAMRQGTADLMKEIFTMFGVFCYLMFKDWKLTLFVLVLIPIIIIPLFVLGKKARRASRESRKANVGQNSLLVEALMGIRVLKAFNLESRHLQRFREFSKKLIHHGMKGVQAKEMVNPIIEIIAAVGVGALIVYLFWSEQSLSTLVTFIAGVAWFFTPAKKIAGVHILFEQAGAGVERLVELMREKPTVVEPAQPKPLKNFEREIRFENVSFSYGERPVLQNVSLTIPRGFKLGIAGESGSGKSTLVNLLFRFYDVTQGRVTLDGIDVRDLSFEDLRRPMALVSQDVFVFRSSVADNIAAGNHGATRAEIEAAARAAKAHDFIMQLPQGYDTIIGERGTTLSGGQRQRLAIARAFVRNAPILVLDEATASLDSHVEAEVQADIDRLEENRTVISVAHRLSTLANMDQIIVLSHGRIVEQGSFDELVRAKGLFANMAAKQGIFQAG
jgi:ABC-type multidrug transport system fused ATPase/permease subunit